jgi:peptide/nickel transport system permease protein
MTRYIIRRSFQSFLLLWLSTLISFSIYVLAPGGPLKFLIQDVKSSPETVKQLETMYGLHRPLAIQYLSWLLGEDWMPDRWQSGRCQAEASDCARGIVRFDFGKSFNFKGQPVIHLIVDRIPATALLSVSSLLLSLVIGIPLGILAALNRGKWIDNLVRVSTVVINTVPDWWIGLLLLIVLGGYLDLVPLSGMRNINDGSIRDYLHHLILPALVSATGGWIAYSRILRFEMLDVLGQDYVRTAIAKGLPHFQVITRHVLRNALIPIVTGFGDIFLLAISGSVLFEFVFAWPGMGRLAYESINSRDYPMLMGLFVISSFLGILGILLVDILYSFVDPRVKYE